MSAGLRKIWADLRVGWREWVLAVAALALGLWGVASIVVANVILEVDLRDNFAQTRPAHAVLVADDFSRGDLQALRDLPAVQSAEWRDFALMRVEVRRDEWIPLWLFGVHDFGDMRIARVQGQQGSFPPPTGSMLIERDGRRISALELGRSAHLRAGSRLLDVPISGIAFDPGQAPATQDHFIYAYVDEPTFARLSGSPGGRRLLLRFNGVRTRDDVRRQVEPLQAWLAARGVTLRSVVVPKFEEHPHQWQLETLLLLQGGIGFLAFAMGAMLVAQLMSALLTKQIRQIAVLKAIGATRGQLLRPYALVLAAMGTVAGGIALPLAWAGGSAFSRFVGLKLNFDIHPERVPALVFVLLTLASLLLPIIVSLPLLRRALNVPVREGLNDYGLAVPAQDGRWQPPAPADRTIAMALRNAVRQRRRTMATVMTMALGVAIFDTGFNVRQSLANLLDDVAQSMSHDVQLVLDAPVTRERALAPLAALPGVRAIETWNGGRGELQSRVVATDGGLGIVALPHDTALFHPRIVAGRWLRPGDMPETVMNQQAAELLGHPGVGQELTLQVHGRPLRARLAGIVEELEKAKLYLDRDDYDRVANPEHLVNSVMLVAERRDYAGVMRLKRDVESAVAASNLDVLYVMSQAERVKIVADHLDIVLTVLVGLSFLVLVVSAVGMASATGIKVRERTREIGVLRAIGATPATILRIVTLEGMASSAVSIALGLALAQPLSHVASVFFGRLMLGEAALRYAFSVSGLLVVAGTTLVFAWFASRVPARAALLVPTREALAHE